MKILTWNAILLAKFVAFCHVPFQYFFRGKEMEHLNASHLCMRTWQTVPREFLLVLWSVGLYNMQISFITNSCEDLMSCYRLKSTLKSTEPLAKEWWWFRSWSPGILWSALSPAFLSPCLPASSFSYLMSSPPSLGFSGRARDFLFCSGAFQGMCYLQMKRLWDQKTFCNPPAQLPNFIDRIWSPERCYDLPKVTTCGGISTVK